MFSIIKRILRLSGKYRPRVIAGLIFNALKSCCAAFVFFAVLLVMLNIEHLTETVILQAFGIVALSVLGRFLFQYLSDVLMSASGYEIFREKRLEIIFCKIAHWCPFELISNLKTLFPENLISRRTH